MINICTVSDKNYLVYGLSMFESLIKYNKNICLNYLCLDDESFYKIKEINKTNLIPYHIDDLVKNNEDFKNLKEKNKPELGGGNRSYFIWGLASFFCYYLLKKDKQDIVYIDSDIQFYENINLIFEKMKDQSICLFRHKHIVKDNPDGLFNIGVVVFKNDNEGSTALKWWRDAVYTREPKRLDTCGDQKFIEGIFEVVNKDKIYIGDKDIGHGAPWHYRFLNFDFIFNENKIVWGDKKQPFLFNHFSKITCDFETKKFSYTGNHYMDHTFMNQLFALPELQKLYVDYFKNLLNIKEKYGV